MHKVDATRAGVEESCPSSGVRLAAGLSEQAYVELAATRPLLVRILRSHWPRLDAEDLASEALAAAWRWRTTYDPTKSSAVGWLVMIAKRLARQSARKRRGVVDVELEDDVAAPAPDPVEALEARRVLGLLRRVPDAEVETLLAVIAHGCELEAGEHMGLSRGAVQQRVLRGRLRLRAASEGKRFAWLGSRPLRLEGVA